MSYAAGKARRTRTIVAALAGVGALALPAGASAQAGAEAEPPFTPAQAKVQLEAAVEALSGADPAAAHPTDELRDLAAAIPYLAGRERREARAILARPPADKGGTEPFGAEWPGNAMEHELSTAHFVVHWPQVPGCTAPAQGCDEPDLTDANGGGGGPPNGIPDYVDRVAMAAEASYSAQNGDLGWPDPKPDGEAGGDDRIDIYISDICDEVSAGGACLFGYASPDDTSAQCHQAPFECFAYLVLDNDYQPAEFGSYSDQLIPMRVTTAHEYNHILQFGIDARQDGWMFESTAVWSEEQVFPGDDDWLFYLRIWKRTTQQPITSFGAGAGLKVYGSGVWNHWLHLGAGYGPDVVLDAWLGSQQTKPKHFAVGAYDRAIKQHGGRGFSHEFGRFAAATAEWQVGDGDFSADHPDDDVPDEQQFPDVKRHGELARGGRAESFKLDHTAYRLLRVKPRGANKVRLRVRARRGVRTAIALVGRDGPATTGELKTKFSYAPKGGKDSVALKNARSYERITAVVVNADGRVKGNSRRYTRNNERYRVSLR